MMKPLTIMAVALTIGVSVASAEAGLIGHWKLDGNATDSSASGANGTENGTVSYVAGVAGQALVADSGNITAANAAIQTQTAYNSYTISAWFREDDASFSQPLGMRTGNDGWEFQTNIGGKAIVQQATPAHWQLAWTQPLVSDGSTWNHLVLTYDNSGAGTMSMYVNGVLSTDASAVNAAAGGGFDVAFNTINIGGSNYTGDIDDVQLYDMALTAQEVALLNANPGLSLAEIPAPAALPAGLALIGLIAARRRR